jgi:hypothetical protein
MNKIKLIIIGFLIVNLAYSQDIEKKKYAIIANIGQQTDVFEVDLGALQSIQSTPFQPRIEVGLERTWKEKRTFRFHQDLKLTFVSDPYIERVYGIGTDFGAEFKILKRILITPRVGIHYNYAKSSDIQYIYNGEKWVKTDNYLATTNRLFLKGGLDLGYRINNKYDVFVNGQYSLNTPHLNEGVPLFLNRAVSLGVRYFL